MLALKSIELVKAQRTQKKMHNKNRMQNIKIIIIFIVSISLLFNFFEINLLGHSRSSPFDTKSQIPLVSPQNSNTNSQDIGEANSSRLNWGRFYYSPQCLHHRVHTMGKLSTHNMGQGSRVKCSEKEKDSKEFQMEIEPSFDVSLLYKAIYIPVMKAGTQLFQDIFKKRLKGTRITGQKQLLEFIHNAGFTVNDFFVFSFVRNPFKIFTSGYEEVNKYVVNNRTRNMGFGVLPVEQEPQRALACLENIRDGYFRGLVPGHLYTQVWKIHRCSPISLGFIGKLEEVDQDWRYIEHRLQLPHIDLPVIHSAGEDSITKKMLKRFELNPAMKDLTQSVCEYYKSDFDCFGYDSSPCKRV